jgi:hypothetical protein
MTVNLRGRHEVPGDGPRVGGLGEFRGTSLGRLMKFSDTARFRVDFTFGKEAKVRHDGLRLGPVGSTIISEVFVGLVNGDRNSFLWQVKNWKPTLASQSTATSR